VLVFYLGNPESLRPSNRPHGNSKASADKFASQLFHELTGIPTDRTPTKNAGAGEFSKVVYRRQNEKIMMF